VFEINERTLRPESLPQVIASNNISGVLQQQNEDLKWLSLGPDAYAVLVERFIAEIHLERAKAHDLRIGTSRHPPTRD
jgi:hypothetical protein